MSGCDGIALPLSAAQREIWFAEQQLNTANQLAPHCETYWTTDFSAPAIDIIAGRLGQGPELATRVVLRTQPAHDTDGLPVGLFDTVILNSVVQYFPTTDYLVDVLTAMLRRLIGMFGCRAENLDGEPLTPARVVEIIRGQGSALASLKEQHISAVAEIMINNTRLALDFIPGRFHGNLLLFTATIDRGDDVPAPEAWRPYVDGKIESHTSPVDTIFMMQPGSLAQIGPILAAKLREITSNAAPSHRES